MREAEMQEDQKVLILSSNEQYRRLFEDAGFQVVQSLGENPHIVCFTGGADVTPRLYGQEPGSHTYFDAKRDAHEARIYAEVLDRGIAAVGICRGGQFLNVMNGGKMHQHVVGHATGIDHLIYDKETGDDIMVSSTHHQMMIPTEDAVVLATANIVKWPKGSEDNEDIEVVFYPRTNSLCFQPHPEFFEPDHECVQYFWELVYERIL